MPSSRYERAARKAGYQVIAGLDEAGRGALFGPDSPSRYPRQHAARSVRVRESARRLGVASRISFSGQYVPIAAALCEVARASCGVIPNRPSLLNRFALSSKLFEYVALEIPVVVSRLETLESHFSDDEVTFFEPGDAASLAEAVRWVATHSKEAEAKTRRARARAAAYSWERQRERYLSLLR